MPPPLPPPAPTTSQSRPTTSHRSSSSTTHSRNATPKQTPSTGSSGGLRSAKVRGSSDKENSSGSGSTAARSAARRPSAGHALAVREKMPSKDGTVQRNAKDVEGLQDYQLGQCLGRGAFGSVYCALNWSTGETVAIKQVRLSDMPKTELNVIMQEIDLLKNLHHPNIVKYHGFVKSADSLYIILEYCEQGSLHSICKNFGKFPENLVALYIAQVLQGLLFLHEQGVIHRDIKGANILTTKEGLIKLADFGVATKQQGLTEGSVVGTPYWMAPEVIELSGATTASDIWSLGCTVIELLDGRPPYHKFAPMPALFRIVNDDHPPLPESASPLVRDFLMQCFQKDPNLRVTAKKLLKHPWIVSAKKGEKTKPTEYDAAIKSVQQWNEALKASPPQTQSGNGSRKVSKSGSRPVSRSSAKSGINALKTRTEPGQTKPAFRLGQRKSQAAETFQSPQEGSRRDNWDADFESLATGVDALQIPDHLRPQDNFAGLLSSEKLKRYAHVESIPEQLDGRVEDWDNEFEGDLTVRSTMHLAEGSALETVRPFYPSGASNDQIKHQLPSNFPAKRRPSAQHERKASKDSQPRTQILKPGQNLPNSNVAPAPQQTKKATQPILIDKDRFREDEEEDYSDLVADDENAFIQKLAGFSPSRPGKVTDIRNMQTQMSGSMRRRRTHTPTQLVHDAAAMRRTRSSLEIQKFAEDAEDEDFQTDLVFDEEAAVLQPSQHNSMRRVSPQSVSSGSSGTLKLTHTLSWAEDEDEDEEEDPFKALEDELDEVDLESNVARDKHARLCAVVESLVSDLKTGHSEDVLVDIVDELLAVLSDSPDVKTVIVSSHGMLPILEILETTTRPHVILRLLKIVNVILYDNIEVQENLCFVGGIPIISRFAQKKYASDIRLEAANFVRMMYQTQTPGLTLQMFISCGGLNVLVDFLEEDYDSEAGRELVLVGVTGIWSVFELQGPTPKNDFCRIFSRSAVLYPLSLVLNRVLDEDDRELADVIESRIVNIFLLFSQAENYVKELIADRMVLKRVLKDLRRLQPANQIVMLKFIKNLSMLATTLDHLQNSNAIEVLTDLLGSSMEQNKKAASAGSQHFRDISNQILATMFNLCRLSTARQEDAALSGIVPLLQKIVKTERPLKEFALPIMCDMAHSGKVGRKILWQNKGLQFYISLLADPYWAVTALDAVFIWLQEETAKVEEHLLNTAFQFGDAVVQCFNESKADTFENLLEPLQKLLRLSPAVAASLAQRTLFDRSAVKMHSKKALVRLNLLRVIRSICDACESQGMGSNNEGGSLLRRYNLLDSVKELARRDPAILVREMANELVKSSEFADVRPPLPSPSSRPSSYAISRRSSSGMGSMLTPSTPLVHQSSTGSTPNLLSTNGRSGYFDLIPPTTLDRRQSAIGIANSSRPMSRDGSASSSSSLASLMGPPHGTSSSRSSSRVPPMSRDRRPPSRMNLATVMDQRERGENGLSLGGGGGGQARDDSITPTHSTAGTRGNYTTQQSKIGHRRRGTGQGSVDLGGRSAG